MKEKGITLIALVITIIVLLILAGISIAMLTGENGILTKADVAKNETEKADIIENARVKIVEKQTENLGTLTEKELTDILTPTYGTLFGNGETVLDKTLKTTNGKYEIPVKEIWNGNLKKEDKTIEFSIACIDDPAQTHTTIAGETWGEWILRLENMNSKQFLEAINGDELLADFVRGAKMDVDCIRYTTPTSAGGYDVYLYDGNGKKVTPKERIRGGELYKIYD